MRRAFVALVTLTAVCGALVGSPPAARATEDARASRAGLLLRSADLTDRLEAAQSAVVAAQMRQRASNGSLARVRGRMRTRAVRAYVRGPDIAVLAPDAPHVYLEVAATKERELVNGYRSASADAATDQEGAESARSELRRASAELARVRSQLEAVIVAEDARRTEEQRQADEARRAAADVRLAEGRRQGEPGWSAPTGGTALVAGRVYAFMEVNFFELGFVQAREEAQVLHHITYALRAFQAIGDDRREINH